MTHVNNYEYVKRWRQNNPELQKLRNKSYCIKIYHYKQTIKEFMRIDTTLFLQESLGVSYKTNNIFFSLN
jgi:hypothetical protein